MPRKGARATLKLGLMLPQHRGTGSHASTHFLVCKLGSRTGETVSPTVSLVGREQQGQCGPTASACLVRDGCKGSWTSSKSSVVAENNIAFLVSKYVDL